ncbi:MAG: cytochrome c oxidase accessory protein CcoG [Gammaproteobacteria bacterium]|nr:cytochrome c oxidase accessory protein CcoG [Gammaproteobacteria bacterium]
MENHAAPEQEMYQKRIPIFPRSVSGKFRNLKYVILFLAYAVYFLLPWLRWARETGPQQAMLFDLDGRRFYIFDLVVYAQDIFWLAGVLIIAAWLLFFVTGLAGRVFCGYFCFQTLWTDLYMLIERLVQGERPARIRLYKAEMSGAKAMKLGTTHFLWLFVSFLTGLSFTLYWADAPQLVMDFFSGKAPFPAYATTLFLTLSTYVMAGLAREQVCTYMCPYSRFQSAMFDRDTLIVAYDEARGEGKLGRAKLSKALKDIGVRHEQGFGDCIDCGYCVQVCPVGIDIRDGMQYQCITCGLCVDACNEIMDSVEYPRGLISYTSDKALSGEKTRWFKAKNIGYAVSIVATTAALIWSVATRDVLELAVRQVRQPLSVTLADGRVQNSYEIKISNKGLVSSHYRIELDNFHNAELDIGQRDVFTLAPEKTLRVMVRVKVDPFQATQSKTLFHFMVVPQNQKDVKPVQHDAWFYIPQNQLGK